MASHCPQCGEHFDESEGFCPFDGTRLEIRPRETQSRGLITVDGPPRVLEMVSALDATSVSDVLARLGPARREYDRLIGTVLDGRYQIERELGEGGMGVVFLARHVVIEKMVAIKILKREVARDHSVVKRFVQEAKAASRIGHPNIVDVTDFGTTGEGMTYSVMEFVEGETLTEIIENQAPLPPARVLPIVAQIARALSAAHEKGIVHRDLKPENGFVIARDGRRDFVKIVDFGIAKVIPVEGKTADSPRLTHAGSVFGTPEYMAPEQAAGRSDTDHRVDIYSLGVICYEMLLGQVPHRGDTLVRTLAMQMLDDIPHPRQVRPDIALGEELEGVLLRALAKKRADRFQTMYQLIARLEGLSNGVPLEQPLSPSAQLVRTAAPPNARTLVPPPRGVNSDALDTLPAVAEPIPPGDPPAGPPAGPGGHSGEAERAHPPAGASGEPASGPVAAPARGAAGQFLESAGRAPGNEPDSDLEARVTSLEKPRSEQKNPLDPAFVQRRRPISFDVLDRDRASGETPAARQRRWRAPAIALACVAAGALFTLLWTQRSPSARPDSDSSLAATAPAEAAPAAHPGPASAPPIDAGVAGVADAAGLVAAPRVSATRPAAKPGVRPHRPAIGPAGERPSRGRVEVQVLTRPDGATLYIDDDYSGKSGTNIRRPQGTRLTVECRLPGHKPGKVAIEFDGVNEVYICRLEQMRCIAGLKNPFADCPE